MIPDINKILYASDLGESSRPAFTLAAKEAFKHNAEITFLNVLEPLSETTAALLGSTLSPASIKEMRAQAKTRVKTLMDKHINQFYTEELVGREGLQHEPVFRVEEGPAAETILQVADELNADLIVMGTRTRKHTALGRLFVGSTAQSVLQHCDRPLLIVPLNEDD